MLSVLEYSSAFAFARIRSSSPRACTNKKKTKFASADASKSQTSFESESITLSLSKLAQLAVFTSSPRAQPTPTPPTTHHTRHHPTPAAMPLSKPQPESEQASVSSASTHFIGPTKPILKLSPAQTPARIASPTPEGQGSCSFGKHAHFPPPGQEHTARYSGLDYDRSPIVVLPNICALPERGCPGKTYFQDGRGMSHLSSHLSSLADTFTSSPCLSLLVSSHQSPFAGLTPDDQPCCASRGPRPPN